MLPEFIPQVLVAFTFLRPHEVICPRLFRVSGVTQRLAAELLAGQVESVTVNNVVAVNVPGLKWDSVNMAAENVLSEEGSNRALSECWVAGRPFMTQAWSASVSAPDVKECVVHVAWSDDAGEVM